MLKISFKLWSVSQKEHLRGAATRRRCELTSRPAAALKQLVDDGCRRVYGYRDGRDDGDHFGDGGDDCYGEEERSSTCGYSHVVTVISGNPEGEWHLTKAETDGDVIMCVLCLCFFGHERTVKSSYFKI